MSIETDVNSPTHSDKTIAGFPPLALKRLRGAQTINRLTIFCIVIAIFAFVVFGTLASLKMFHGSQEMYALFHYLPYLMVTLTIPFTLYQAFLVLRYRLCQPSMLLISVGGSILLTLVSVVFSLSDWLWIGVAYWFQATFKRLFKFIDEHR